MALDALTLRETLALGGAIARAWWADICSYIPQPLVNFFEAEPQGVVIRLAKDRLTITGAGKDEGSAASEVLFWQDRTDELESQLKRALGSSLKRQENTHLVLGPDMVLVRRLTWPLVAEASVARLLLGQLDALTPWSGEDAWVGWRIARRQIRARRIDVEVHVAPKKRLAGLTEMVKRVTGGDVTLFSEGGLTDGGPGLHLQEMDRQRSGQRARKVWDVCIFCLPVLLVLLIAWMPARLDRQYLNQLKSESESLRADVDKSIAAGKSVADLMQEFAALRAERSEKRSVTEVLDLLSTALGDDIWLDRFIVSGGKVELSGSALDPYSMVSSLQAMDEVRDVRLKSPVVKGKQEGQQRFQIELQMEGRE